VSEMVPGQLDAQLGALQASLDRLDGAGFASRLPAATADAMGFVACCAAIARRVLAIEDASRALLDNFSLRDPLAIEDARTVRASSVGVLDPMADALSLVGAWAMDPPADQEAAELAVRARLHTLSNSLVGINCYAELLSVAVPEGDPCHEALVAVIREGAGASRLVRERLSVQRHLKDLAAGGLEWEPGGEWEPLACVLEGLGQRVSSEPTRHGPPNPERLWQALASLPPAEQHVVQEALRRFRSASRPIPGEPYDSQRTRVD
jgi:hypothetical protein